jgi:subtilisin-like proprotein convertase family protein
MKNLYRNLILSMSFGLAVNANAALITDVTNNVSVAVDDLSSASSTINIAQHGLIDDINILINNLTHGWDEDLILSITHSGTTAILSFRNGGSGGADYLNTVFDDEAGIQITSGIAYAPYSGSFIPEELLSAFDGMDIFGDWVLTVTDMEAGDSGAINSWGIKATSTKVPEPSSIMLLSLGLLALFGRKLRAQRS